MKILAIADEPSPRLWGEHCREMLEGVELILSAGDLPSDYLSYLTCFSHAPVVYVYGNHDGKMEKAPPEGCLCAEDRILLINGVRILGLGGSMRYRPGSCMYSEKEMEDRIRRLRGKLRKTRGFDILLTHAPMRGHGDQEDLAHRGFACFESLITRYCPSVMVHGHVHQSYTGSHFQREQTLGNVRILNVNPVFSFEFVNKGNIPRPTKLRQYILERETRKLENGK